MKSITSIFVAMDGGKNGCRFRNETAGFARATFGFVEDGPAFVAPLPEDFLTFLAESLGLESNCETLLEEKALNLDGEAIQGRIGLCLSPETGNRREK